MDREVSVKLVSDYSSVTETSASEASESDLSDMMNYSASSIALSEMSLDSDKPGGGAGSGPSRGPLGHGRPAPGGAGDREQLAWSEGRQRTLGGSKERERHGKRIWKCNGDGDEACELRKCVWVVLLQMLVMLEYINLMVRHGIN